MFEVPDRDALALAVGDHLAIVAIVGWGVVDHNGVDGLTDSAELAGTIGPFLVGFAVAALLVGCYEPTRTATAATQLRSVVAAAVGGVGIGLVIRTSPLVDGGAVWPFGLVMIGTITVGLLFWRVLAIAAGRWRSGATESPGRETAGE
ncbi:DUF3054 domain-containing protein [Salinarchaeum laminariae]|uniref:DUF3054 domain-containing protein n=1 Tax=Salinarchaeum laminariae TaxID=869888 RepID=UPI0020BE365C|nr:DUF3054 domain-containing protein [Salinarchaeum laminariae]